MKIDGIFKKRDFYDQFEFCGSLRFNDVIADHLHIFIEYPRNIAGRIDGYIIGDNETFNRLTRVFDESSINVHLKSEQSEDDGQNIYSETFSLKNVINKGWTSEYGDCMQSIVAEFELDDVIIQTKHQDDNSKGRHLLFSLVGPRSFWPVSAYTEFHEMGKFESNVINEIFPIVMDFPAEIKIRPSYSMETSVDNEKIQTVTKSMILEIKTNESQSSLPDKIFLEQSSKFVDDILILASFASGAPIDWYRRELSTPLEYQIYTKQDTRHYIENIDRKNLFIDPKYAYDFLKIGINRYRTLQKEGFDIYYPLLYFIAGNQNNYLEERFPLLFFSLEKIANLYSAKKGYNEINSATTFSDLRIRLLDILSDIIKDPLKIKWIEKKIPELNRPPIRDIIEEKMFVEYGVEWRDLYPHGADFNIFKVRNELFHTAKRPDIDVLGNATERLKYIVARLILKILDWKGKSNTPPNHMRNFLSEQIP